MHKRSSPTPAWPEEPYSWASWVREWVSAPPVHFAATLEEVAAHLDRWKQHWLAKEQADDKRQMLWAREEEEACREEEEERSPCRNAAATADT
jgi:hypothetical protein